MIVTDGRENLFRTDNGNDKEQFLLDFGLACLGVLDTIAGKDPDMVAKKDAVSAVMVTISYIMNAVFGNEEIQRILGELNDEVDEKLFKFVMGGDQE